MHIPISILIVDDYPLMVDTLADILESKGFKVYLASCASEALQVLELHPVDILLTDVIMPGMNGVALFAATREKHPALTTYLMTAYAEDDLIQQGIAEGIKTVLQKPVDIDLLLALIQH
jgi:two-component system response regulator HydG